MVSASSSSSPLAGVNITTLLGTTGTPPISEKTTLTLPVRAESPLPQQSQILSCQQLRHAMLRSSTPSTLKLTKLATGSPSFSNGIEPSPMSLERNSLSAVTLSSSSLSLLPMVDPKERKDEIVSTAFITNRVVSQISTLPSPVRRSRHISTNKPLAASETTSQVSSLPFTVQQHSPAKKPLRNLPIHGRPPSSFSVVNRSVNDIENLINQLRHNPNESHIPILKMRIRKFLEKYPIKTHSNNYIFIIRMLKCRIEFNCDYNKTQLEADLFQSIDRLEIKSRLSQLRHNPTESHVPTLKVCIQKFSEKYPNEREFIIQILKCCIELNYRDHLITQLEDPLLHFEGNLLKLKELCCMSVEKPFVLKWEGILYHAQSKIDNAIECLLEALELIPKDSQVMTQLGLLYIKKAEEKIDRKKSQLTKAQIQELKEERYNKALEFLEKAIKIDSRNLLAVKRCSYVYYHLKKIERALEYAMVAVNRDSKDNEANRLYKEAFNAFLGLSLTI